MYDREGHQIGPMGERGIMFDVNISPDGEHVAVNRGEPADIWVYELARGTSLRLTFDKRNETLPVWSPDGRSVAYARIERDGKAAVMEAPVAGGEAKELWPPGEDTVSDWSSDGKYLLLRQGEMLMSPGDIWVAPADEGIRRRHEGASPDGDARRRIPRAVLAERQVGELRVERIGA